MSVLEATLDAVTPEVADRIGNELGLPGAKVRKALQALVPVVLAVVIRQARSIDGQKAISNMLPAQDADLIDTLRRDVSLDMNGAAASGMNGLRTLIGGNNVAAIASGLGRYADLSETSAGKLLGLASAMVMGAIGNLWRDHWMDAESLVPRLSLDAPAAAAVIPAEVARGLRETGLLHGVEGKRASKPNTLLEERRSSRPPVGIVAALAALIAAGVTFLIAVVLPLLLAPKNVGEARYVPPNGPTAMHDAADDQVVLLQQTAAWSLDGNEETSATRSILEPLQTQWEAVSTPGSQVGSCAIAGGSINGDLGVSPVPSPGQMVGSMRIRFGASVARWPRTALRKAPETEFMVFQTFRLGGRVNHV